MDKRRWRKYYNEAFKLWLQEKQVLRHRKHWFIKMEKKTFKARIFRAVAVHGDRLTFYDLIGWLVDESLSWPDTLRDTDTFRSDFLLRQTYR